MANHTNKKMKKQGFFSRIARFFKDTLGEMKKVTWTTKKQVVNNTLVVIAFVFVTGVCIWSVDFVMGALMQMLLNNV